ncbi:Smr domain-containing protein [Mucilaginibacter yixingensis]|uniref:Smr domain-containing protein n=1 Tax=Mucilaginibacter yixingensis TaxID=1295612 RepID=A0A2T5J981_9SPHI|nr:Smr/MutS family protein [Mucilaginibacter yixingensis]PTQ96617.1 Smr domain-containing protein [Mucilaginibacter yixingensis]
MKYKLGDFVRFVDEKMEGFVTRIIDEQMIGVSDEDGFEIPVLASKVTFVHGHEPAREKQNGGGETTATIHSETASESDFGKGVYLGVVNDPKAGSVVHFYLLNDTAFQLLTAMTTEKQQSYKGEYAGLTGPKSGVKIYSAQLADLQLWPAFIFHITYFTTQNSQPPAPVVFNYRFKAKDFSGAKKKLPLLNEMGWMIRLDEPEPIIDAQKLKESFFKSAAEKTEIEKPAGEVDLHIEKLRDDHWSLKASEILAIQLARFHKALDAAIVHQLPEIVFIHGAGNGTLKQELHKALGKHQKVRTFMDARKEKFGYGATKVIFK